VGIEPADISELSIADMSKIIESLNDIAPKIREGNEICLKSGNSKNYYLKSVFKYSIISKNKIYKKYIRINGFVIRINQKNSYFVEIGQYV